MELNKTFVKLKLPTLLIPKSLKMMMGQTVIPTVISRDDVDKVFMYEMKSYSGSYRFEPLTEIRIDHLKKLASI